MASVPTWKLYKPTFDAMLEIIISHTWKLYKPTFGALLEIIISHINHTNVFIMERV